MRRNDKMEPMKYLEELVERYPVLDVVKDDVLSAYKLLEGCYAQGGKLLIAGNGGSCADSEHIVGELMKGGYGKPGDVLMGISTSGNAKNVMYALTVAKALGMKTIGLTGKDGGALKREADTAIVVPETETFKIQELHLPVYHALCLMLEERFF